MSSSELDTEIDLIELVDVLWQGKYLIGGLTAFVSLIAFVFLFFMPSTHQIFYPFVAVAARNECLCAAQCAGNIATYLCG